MAKMQHAATARIWVDAARPRTLPLAVVPVLAGTAAASRPVTELDAGRFALALLVALGLQVAVNYANDYFDGVRGVDSQDRAGPPRAVASGQVHPAAMRIATGLALAVAGLAGLALALLVGWELLIVGAVAMLAALGYSGGGRPYASRGFGEVSVFVFFGLVATAGSAYVQDESLTVLPLVAAVPIGLVAVAVLVANNLRDIPTDFFAGKRTLAVRLGERATRDLFATLVLASLLGVAVTAVIAGSLWPLVAVLSAPLGFRASRMVRNTPIGSGLIPALGATVRYHLAVGILLAAGLAAASP